MLVQVQLLIFRMMLTYMLGKLVRKSLKEAEGLDDGKEKKKKKAWGVVLAIYGVILFLVSVTDFVLQTIHILGLV